MGKLEQLIVEYLEKPEQVVLLKKWHSMIYDVNGILYEENADMDTIFAKYMRTYFRLNAAYLLPNPRTESFDLLRIILKEAIEEVDWLKIAFSIKPKG